jgi:hypothetical protein
MKDVEMIDLKENIADDYINLTANIDSEIDFMLYNKAERRTHHSTL